MTSSDVNKSNRLVEIDFFRGVALLVIFWDHLHWFVGLSVPLRYGFSDMAATFIFLSGYVSGLVYWKVYRFQGFRSMLLKACRRAVQIYAAHLTALIFLLSFAVFIPVASLPNPLSTLLGTFTADSFHTALRLFSLQNFPLLFNILPLYIVLILAVPWALLLLKIDWKIGFGLSFALYCATQSLPELNVRYYYPCWSLNLLSWFLLFGVAMTIAIKSRDGSLRVPVRRSYVAAALCLLAYSFFGSKIISQVLQNAGVVTDRMAVLFPSPFPLIGKSSLQPVYLLHFLCLAYVISVFAPRLRPFFNSRFAYPLVLCGQHSLPLFTGGIVLTYLFAYFVVALGGTPILFYLFAILGWIGTIGFALILSRKDSGLLFLQSKLRPTMARTVPVDGFGK